MSQPSYAIDSKKRSRKFKHTKIYNYLTMTKYIGIDLWSPEWDKSCEVTFEWGKVVDIKFSEVEKYIPYSIRHNITDKDLAWLLDYLERIMGWEIDYKNSFPYLENQWWIEQKNGIFYIWNNGWSIHIYTWEQWESWNNRPAFSEMTQELFFRSYKTLLPVIRDLYSK